jgi:excinuclease ABC subunit C
VRALRQAAEKNPDALTAVVNKATAKKIQQFFATDSDSSENSLTVLS